MPALRSRFGGPKRLLWSFALILLLPAAAVGWLGLRMLDQDRDLESRLRLERRHVAADRLVSALDRAIAATERQLDVAPGSLAIATDADAVMVTFRAEGVDASPRNHLVFGPIPPVDVLESDAAFDQGEALEFNGALGRAAAVYRTLASGADRTRRAGALVRLARTQRKLGLAEDALSSYQALAGLGNARVAGLPADLVGTRARLALLAELGRSEELRRGARALQRDLGEGRWVVDRGTLVSYAAQARAWAGDEPRVLPERVALADAVDWLWQEWRAGRLAPSGRLTHPLDGADVTMLWRRRGTDGVTALLAGPRFRARTWLEPLGENRRFDVAFESARVNAPRVERSPAPDTVRRSAADTGLPWTLVLVERAAGRPLDEVGSRRHVVVAGLSLLLLVVLAGAVVVARGVAHELAVARLQSDFVSAVSHEFRTPLTSLRQFTSLLTDEEEPSPEKRRAFYQAQARAVNRLQNLVESLLDFGRIEAGAYPYRMVRIAVTDFVTDVVDGFRGDGAPADFVVECTCAPGCGDVVADEDALGRALRNLLENAVKYSGHGRHIAVRATRAGRTVRVRVTDQGLGIPSSEQQQIFTKFVRGAASRTYGINGSGIGLAMAREIVRAHGGDITVESDGRTGSTFTMTLPSAGEGARPEDPTT